MPEQEGNTLGPAGAKAPPAPRGHSLFGRVMWWLCYTVVAAVVVALFIFAEAWWMRGTIALIAIVTVIRFIQADRELHEKFRGHCCACGHDVFVDDPWCPHCGGSVKVVR